MHGYMILAVKDMYLQKEMKSILDQEILLGTEGKDQESKIRDIGPEMAEQ